MDNPASTAVDIVNCHQNMGLLAYDLGDWTQCNSHFSALDENELTGRGLEFYGAHSLQESGDDTAAIRWYTMYLERVDRDDIWNAVNVRNAFQNLGIMVG